MNGFNPHFGAPNPWRPGALAPTCPPLATPLYLLLDTAYLSHSLYVLLSVYLSLSLSLSASLCF